MISASRFGFFVSLTLSLILFLSCILLVDRQNRVRTVFLEHERAMKTERQLRDDQAELLMKVRAASLPGRIAQSASEFGLVPAVSENTYTLTVKENGGRP